MLSSRTAFSYPSWRIVVCHTTTPVKGARATATAPVYIGSRNVVRGEIWLPPAVEEISYSRQIVDSAVTPVIGCSKV